MALDKSDTVMRIDYSASATADQSQFGHTLTGSGSGGYLDPSAETALDGSGAGREISIRFRATNANNGTIVYHGSTAGAINWQVKIQATATLNFLLSVGSINTIALPSASAANDWYQLSICTRPNPLTTGASDAMTTEFAVYNETQASAWTIEQVHHAIGTVSASNVFSYFGLWDGASLTDPFAGSIEDIRVGGRFKSTTEQAIDWGNYTPSTPPTTEKQADPLIAPDSVSELADGGSVAGPAYQLMGAHVRDAARRLVCPLVNTSYPEPEPQGRTNLVAATRNSAKPESLTALIAENPGYTDGPSGWPEKARDFVAASTQHFESPASPNFLGHIQGSDHTISAWVKWDDTGSHPQTIAGLCGGGGATGADNDCCVIDVESTGALTFSWMYSTASNAATLTTTTTLTAGVWTHVAFVCVVNGADLEVTPWIAGVEDASGTYTARLPSHGTNSLWEVGCYYDVGTTTYSQHFDGAICEYKIANTAYADDWIEFEAARDQGFLYQEGEVVHWQLRQCSDGYTPARAYMDVTLGTDTYKAHLDTLVRRPVHGMTDKWLARVLASVGLTGTGTVDTINIAVVATNRQPGKLIMGGAPDKTVYATTAANGGTGILTWYTLEGYELPRDEEDCCWFYLASEITTVASANDTAIRFDGLQIVPYSLEPTSSYPDSFTIP